jgi:hypothetical protein
MSTFALNIMNILLYTLPAIELSLFLRRIIFIYIILFFILLKKLLKSCYNQGFARGMQVGCSPPAKNLTGVPRYKFTPPTSIFWKNYSTIMYFIKELFSASGIMLSIGSAELSLG